MQDSQKKVKFLTSRKLFKNQNLLKSALNEVQFEKNSMFIGITACMKQVFKHINCAATQPTTLLSRQHCVEKNRKILLWNQKIF